MRSATCILRRLTFVALVALVGGTIAPLSLGQTVDVALNVRYTIPGNVNSGGTWRLVAHSSGGTFGISALQVSLTAASITGSPSGAGPIGVVNGDHDAGFSIFESTSVSNQKLLAISQLGRVAPLPAGQEQSIFYGVGTLANGAPNFPGKPAGSNSIGPAFTTLSDTARIPWATSIDSLGDPVWSTAAALATGAFAPGSTPGIIGGSANVFTSLGTSTTIGTIANVTGANFISHGLRIAMGIAGDYNGNGIVDAADYSIWRNHSGQAFQLLNEGPDTPGEVTIEDYNFWKANFGLGGPGAGSGSASAFRPELAPPRCPNQGPWPSAWGRLGSCFCGRNAGFRAGFRYSEKCDNRLRNCLTHRKRRSIMSRRYTVQCCAEGLRRSFALAKDGRQPTESNRFSVLLWGHRKLGVDEK